MKITIDTKEDSTEDLQAAVALLQSLLGKESTSTTSQAVPVADMFGAAPVQSSETETAQPVMDMFGSPAPTESQSEPEEKEEDSNIQIIPF